MKKMQVVCVIGMALCFGGSAFAGPTLELITNGGFESGSLAGWTDTNLGFSSGSWSVDTPGTTTPVSGSSTSAVGSSGSYYAVTDQSGFGGSHSLTQTFTVASPLTSATLSWDMFVNSSAAVNGEDSVLDHRNPYFAQFASVDILTQTAGAFDSPVSLSSVLANYYAGIDGAGANDFANYTIDITSIVGAGGTFQIRFADAGDSLLNMGIDNVSILAEPAPVPAPGALLLAGLGSGVVGFFRRRQWA